MPRPLLDEARLLRLGQQRVGRALPRIVSWLHGRAWFRNRLTQSGTGNPTPPAMTLTYDQSTNRITTAGYEYDLNGNLTHTPQSQSMPEISNIAWDVFDRMTQTTANGVTTTYKYDAFGRRVARTTPSGTDTFFYDQGGRLLATYRWSNPTVPELTTYFAGQKLGLYNDRVGSVRYQRTGDITNHYYPYGELVAGASNTGFKFAETYRDDSGLDYAINRYYASGIGRFLSVDPYKDSARGGTPQSWNRYAYVRNDPVNFRDPSGLDLMGAIGRALGAIWDWLGSERPGDEPVAPDIEIIYVDYWAGVQRRPATVDSGGGPAVPTVSNLNKNSDEFLRVIDALDQIGQHIDDSCRSFLETENGTGMTLSGTVAGLRGDAGAGAYVAVANVSPNTNAAFTNPNPASGVPDGYAAIVVNASGPAFVNLPGFTYAGGHVQMGTVQALVFTMLHETAHLMAARGFNQADAGDQSAIDANDTLIWDNCRQTITRFQ